MFQIVMDEPNNRRTEEDVPQCPCQHVAEKSSRQCFFPAGHASPEHWAPGVGFWRESTPEKIT